VYKKYYQERYKCVSKLVEAEVGRQKWDEVEGCASAEGGGVRLPLISLVADGGFGDFGGSLVGVASE
jgi:hypothetical protein